MADLSSLAKVINAKSLVVAVIAVMSTWLSLRFRLEADLPDTLMATAIVFPLVFSIGTAYQRREKVLEDYGELKAHARALYLAARDWAPIASPRRAAEIQREVRQLLDGCRAMFLRPVSEAAAQERQVYASISRLSRQVGEWREAGLASTECSRCNQYVSKLVGAFENIRHIYEYRTPRSLRSFSDFFILLMSLLYGPYFAFQASKFSEQLFFVLPVIYALILVGLANIQDHLENPFDQVGEDDVVIDPDRFADSLTAGEEPRAVEPRLIDAA